MFSTPALSRIVSAPENTDEIIAYKNTHLSVKTKNMMMHGLRAGTVVSLLNAAQIQTTEDQPVSYTHLLPRKAITPAPMPPAAPAPGRSAISRPRSWRITSDRWRRFRSRRQVLRMGFVRRSGRIGAFGRYAITGGPPTSAAR